MKDKRPRRKRTEQREQVRAERAAARPAPPRVAQADLLVPAFILIAALIIYWPALGGAFLWDDTTSIVENPLMRQPGGLRMIWTTPGSIPLELHYWPMTYTALWLQFRLWAESPMGYHLFNVAIYAAIAIQIWRLMRRLKLPGAWLGALLFLVHPVHVESVAWIIGVKDLLATGLSLFAIEFFFNYHDRGGRKWLVCSCVAAAAAILSKTAPVTLPLILLIVLWYRDGRVERRAWGGLALLAGVVWTFAAADIVIGSRLANPIQEIPPFLNRLIQSGWAFWFYWLKLVWPVRLSPFYPMWDLSPARLIDWLPLVAAAGVTLFAWLMRHRIGRGAVAVWLFYAVSLAPAVGVVFIDFLLNTPTADRYQFMASIGPIVGFAAFVGQFSDKGLRWIKPAAVLALIALAAMSWRQAGFYQDMEKLFLHAQTIAPDSPEVCSNLGFIFSQNRRYEDAEKLLRKAIRLRPNDWNAVCHFGTLMAKQNRIRNAVDLYKDAVRAGCNHADVLANLAFMLATTPDPSIYDPERALQLAQQSLAGNMAISPTYLNALAAAQMALGKTAEGLSTARQALQLARDTHATNLVNFIEQLIPIYEQGQPCIMPVDDRSK